MIAAFLPLILNFHYHIGLCPDANKELTSDTIKVVAVPPTLPSSSVYSGSGGDWCRTVLPGLEVSTPHRGSEWCSRRGG